MSAFDPDRKSRPRSIVYFSLSQLKIPVIVLPPKLTFGCVVLMINSLSPSSLNVLAWSVPTQASFHATSTLVINLLPSRRNFPEYAIND